MRLHGQISDLLRDKDYPVARMATMVAVLHHKMEHFFWTGFYLLVDEALVVGPYQGPVACILLERDKGVCWAGLNQGKTIVVPDVHQFPGHIACDAETNSEIVVPIILNDNVVAVLDIDSPIKNRFDNTDKISLEMLCEKISANCDWQA